MTKKEKFIHLMETMITGEDDHFLKEMFVKYAFTVEKDPRHDDAFNVIVDESNETNIVEPGSYNIAVLDDCVCFHRFAVRGSVFMHFSADDDTLFNEEPEYASTHEGLLQSLKSTITIRYHIISFLNETYKNTDWKFIETLKSIDFDFVKGESNDSKSSL